MAIYDFYNGYNIDDSDIWCDKVIVSQCSEAWSDMPNHVYKSICELIADCPAIHQLQKDCVVDFLNADRSNVYDWNVPKFLKLNSSWCLEWWTLECPCSDELVKASACDTHAWYLEEKLEWWTSEYWLYSIDVNTVSCNKIEITPEWPNNTYIRAWDVPDSWSWDIRYKNWNIYYVEDLDTDTTSNISYARWYHKWWSCLVPTNDWWTVWWVNQWQQVWGDQHYFPWSTLLKWTKDIVKWSWHHLFWLTRPWVYQINLNSCVRIWDDNNPDRESWVFAIRWWIITDWGWTYTMQYAGKTCWDVKYQARIYSQNVNDFYPSWDSVAETWWTWTARHLELWIMSFSSSYMLHLENASPDAPVWICFRIRYDTRVWADPRNVWNPNVVELRLCSDWDDEPWSMSPWVDQEWTNTVITCARIWEYPRLRTL